jgi:Tfp pilus assembly protein PilN
MRAVNLIPGDARRGRAGGPSATPATAAMFALLGLLAVAVAFLTIYVLTNNTIADRKAQVANLQAQVAQEQAAAERLGSYVQFAQLAQTRVQTVREIAAARFNWYSALSDLSRVVPSNTSLQSLSGTVVPGAGGATSSSGTGATSVRGDITAPAFELTGCTSTQDDVARLMSRLRVINGVTRVTLGTSQKSGGTQGGTSGTSSTSPASGSGGGQACGNNAPSFDIVVFFNPVPGAGATGIASVNGSTPSGAVK